MSIGDKGERRGYGPPTDETLNNGPDFGVIGIRFKTKKFTKFCTTGRDGPVVRLSKCSVKVLNENRIQIFVMSVVFLLEVFFCVNVFTRINNHIFTWLVI